MKKLINDPQDCVEELISGLLLAHDNLARIDGVDVIVRADAEEFRVGTEVALLSGGGSGHEPAHAGFVGKGMLSGAILGDVFSSPSPQQVLQAIRRVTGPAGCLLVVKNYTGDRLNFGLAQEMARAEGLQVEMVVVADDVALEDPEQRRGVAGTVLVHKVAGYYASHLKANLQQVKKAAELAACCTRSMGVALGPCIIPKAGKPSFELGEREIELGLGIHGEPGIAKGDIESANVLIDKILKRIMADVKARGPVGSFKSDKCGGCDESEEAIVLVNGLGATPGMELYICAKRVVATLKETYGITAVQMVVGNLMTSLEMPGMSVSLLPLAKSCPFKQDIIAAMYFATEAPAWPRVLPGACRAQSFPAINTEAEKQVNQVSGDSAEHEANPIVKAIRAVCKSLDEHADELTELDRLSGDGDLGISMRRGSAAVLERLTSFPLSTPADTLHRLALVIQEHLGGTSGPLYAIFFLRTAAVLKEQSESGSSAAPLQQWATALMAGYSAIQQLGGAAPGDATMLDALHPALTSLLDSATASEGSLAAALSAAAVSAATGASSTVGMVPRKGRGRYLGDRAREHKDGGAACVAVIFASIASHLQE